MKLPILALAFVLAAASPASAAQVQLGDAAGYDPDQVAPCLTDAQRAEIQARLAAARRSLRAQGLLAEPQAGQAAQSVLFGWPLRPRSGYSDYDYHGISNFVDHDPAYPNSVLDYNCGTRTYDQASGYNHAGTDFFTWPFPFYMMDHDEIEIVAAAPGTIIGKDDGNFDKNCGFGSGNWNAVYVEHADGTVAWYGHMKNGSPTSKPVGAAVLAGEYLGVVGSSGNSTGPHLHFEVYDAVGQLVDPWAGPCNPGVASSWWQAQKPYYDSGINALMTHSAAPVFPACPATETLNTSDTFVPGQTAYFAAYYRDQLQGQVTDFTVTDAVGTTVAHWPGTMAQPYWAASYWYWYFGLPTSGFALGQWKFQAVYQSATYYHYFYVVPPTAAESRTPEELALALASANPAAGGFTFEYRLPAAGPARLEVLDVAGRRVALLVDGTEEAGAHRASWDTARGGFAPAGRGIYLVRLTHGGRSRACKVAVLE